MKDNLPRLKEDLLKAAQVNAPAPQKIDMLRFAVRAEALVTDQWPTERDWREWIAFALKQWPGSEGVLTATYAAMGAKLDFDITPADLAWAKEQLGLV